ncbi:pyocin activator PrtN family protein [Paraburkholderia heleia]|uniref:pyocin activator PrtN family protein n=1 Tax=Paraburkholderia heleia TaxID=634127 RepID=UPI0005A89457|nr:pyocin activator PrtN family protein [Paraburkholderia heleia]
MNTAFLLMAQFGARAAVPLSEVQQAYFPHLAERKLLEKINKGEIALPVIRAERSVKTARSVHIQDLADYIDARRAEAMKECSQLCGLK